MLFKSSNEYSTPFFSVPAIGCPGTKLQNLLARDSLAALTIPPLTLPTSVMIVLVDTLSAIFGNIFSDTDRGVPITTTSAPFTACEIFFE